MSFIQPQLNDPVIDSLRQVIEKIKKSNRLFYIGEKNEDVYNLDKEDFLKDFAKIINDRFGFKIKPKDAGFFAIYPIFDIDKLNMVNSIKKEAVKKGITEATFKTDAKKAIKNAKEFKQWINKNTLVINTEKAYIEKLPSSIVITMYVSIKDIGLGRKDDLTTDEIIAVILHEIGHVFNSLEAYVNVHYTTQRLLDSFLNNKYDNIREMGITTNEEDPYVVANKNKSDVIIKIYKQLEEDTSSIKLSKAGVNYTDSEFEADSFVTRFGLSDSLVSALIKFKELKSYSYRHYPLLVTISIIKFMLSSLISILVFIFTGSLSLFLAAGLTLFMLSLTVKIAIVMLLSIHTRISNGDEHGSLLTRLSIIKTQTIQMIRKSNITQKEKEKLITVLDNLNDDIAFVETSPANSILAILFDVYSTPNMSIEDNLALIVDKLINNGLWMYSVKFKTLLRKSVSEEGFALTYNKFMGNEINKLTVAEEDSIYYQGFNDPIVVDLINFYKKVIDNNILTNTVKYLDLAKEMSAKLNKRFGLNIIPIPAVITVGGPACMPFILSDTNGFYSSSNIIKYPLPLSPIGVMSTINFIKSKKLISDLVNKITTVDIDLEKGYIKGLNGYSNFLFITFGRDRLTGISTYKTLGKLAFTPEELTAFTLHEIGHIFTFIKELKSSVISITLLRDKFLTIKDNVKNLNIDNNTISVKNTYKDLTEFKNIARNVITEISYIFISIFTNLPDNLTGRNINRKMAEVNANIKNIPMLNNLKETMTMSETEADNFAAMFGVSKYLTTGLEKYMGTVSKKALSQLFSIYLALAIAFMKNLLNIYRLPIIIITIISISILYSLFGVFRVLLGEYFPYEKFPNRIDRLKQNLITILRKENISKEQEKEIIDTLDFLVDEVKELEASPAGSILATIFVINPSLGKNLTVEQRQLDMLLDMIENEQYYFSKKFEQLIRS